MEPNENLEVHISYKEDAGRFVLSAGAYVLVVKPSEQQKFIINSLMGRKATVGTVNAALNVKKVGLRWSVS